MPRGPTLSERMRRSHSTRCSSVNRTLVPNAAPGLNRSSIAHAAAEYNLNL